MKSIKFMEFGLNQNQKLFMKKETIPENKRWYGLKHLI